MLISNSFKLQVVSCHLARHVKPVFLRTYESLGVFVGQQLRRVIITNELFGLDVRVELSKFNHHHYIAVLGDRSDISL